MSIFKKKTALLELVNKFDNMDKKIDTISNRFDLIKLVDNRCDCQVHESRLCNELKEFIEDKVLNLREFIEDKVLNLKESVLISYNSKSIEDKELNILKNIIEETCDKHTIQLNTILEKCNISHSLKNVDLYSQIKSVSDQIQKLNELSKLEVKRQDLSLRTDLQTFLVGLQTNINSSISNNQVEIINNFDNIKENTKESIKEVLDKVFDLSESINNFNTKEVLDKVINLSENINTNVKSFFFENEIIKHQFALEEDIQKYNVEIDNLRILAINAKDSIQETLSKLKSELLPELSVTEL